MASKEAAPRGGNETPAPQTPTPQTATAGVPMEQLDAPPSSSRGGGKPSTLQANVDHAAQAQRQAGTRQLWFKITPGAAGQGKAYSQLQKAARANPDVSKLRTRGDKAEPDALCFRVELHPQTTPA